MSCKPLVEPDQPQAGSADFSRYVAIGNSLTAGYADGTLYRDGQLNSYPAILAEQLKLVGGGTFTQPLLPGNAGWPDVKRVLAYATNCSGESEVRPVWYSGHLDTAGSATNIADQGPFNNMGIPGIRCIDFLINGYGYFNPFSKRFFSPTNTTTPLEVALQIKPTFFTLWLGSNDVLGYAVDGGAGAPEGVGLSDITPLSLFKMSYDQIVEKLTEQGAQGVLINIPDITSTPYFTTINPKGLQLTAARAEALNAQYASSGISFTEGDNYYVTIDPEAPGGVRKLQAGEYVLLSVPIDSLRCGTWGASRPIPASYVLSADEAAHVNKAIKDFNQVIAENAEKHQLGLLDANAFMKSMMFGYEWNNVKFTAEYISGGTFSLDGIHLTPRGYAIVANEIIRVINRTYSASIPEVDILKYNGILMP